MPRKPGPVKPKTDAEKASEIKANRTRFLEIGSGRTSKVISAIQALVKVANKRAYEFDGQDISEMLDPIKRAVTELETKFRSSLSAPSGTRPVAETFKFSRKA